MKDFRENISKKNFWDYVNKIPWQFQVFQVFPDQNLIPWLFQVFQVFQNHYNPETLTSDIQIGFRLISSKDKSKFTNVLIPCYFLLL